MPSETVGELRDGKEPRMDTNEHELVSKEEVSEIVGCAMEAPNELGHGLLEKPYS